MEYKGKNPRDNRQLYNQEIWTWKAVMNCKAMKVSIK